MLGLRQLLDCLTVCVATEAELLSTRRRATTRRKVQSTLALAIKVAASWTFEQTFSTVWDICTSCKLRRQRCKEHREAEGERETRSAACDVQRQQLRDIKQNLKGFAPQNGNWQLAMGNGQPDGACSRTWQAGKKATKQKSFKLGFSFSFCSLDAFRHFCFLIIFQMFRGPALAGRRTLQVPRGGEGRRGLCGVERQEKLQGRHDKLCARFSSIIYGAEWQN